MYHASCIMHHLICIMYVMMWTAKEPVHLKHDLISSKLFAVMLCFQNPDTNTDITQTHIKFSSFYHNLNWHALNNCLPQLSNIVILFMVFIVH